MAEIVKSGDRKATTFLIGEIERLFDGQSLDGGRESRVGGLPARTDKSGTFYLISDLSVECVERPER